MIKMDMMNTDYKLECITKRFRKVKKSKVKIAATIIILVTLSGLMGLIYDRVYGGNFYDKHNVYVPRSFADEAKNT